MPQKKITYEDLVKSLHELSLAQKETDRQSKKTDQKLDKLAKTVSEMTKESKYSIDGMTKESKYSLERLDKLAEMIGGVSTNLGKTAEELFYNSFSKTMALGNKKFHLIERNKRCFTNGIQDEFDIVLTNDSLKLIVEVKHRFHPNDVKKVSRKIENFKKLFPEYKDLQIIGAVAGLSMPEKTINLAQNNHFFVLTQDGNDLKLLHNPDQKRKESKEY